MLATSSVLLDLLGFIALVIFDESNYEAPHILEDIEN
jgi:hypothetical protein